MYGDFAPKVEAEAGQTPNSQLALQKCETYISGTVNVLDCDFYRVNSSENHCDLPSACWGYFATNGMPGKDAPCPMPVPQCYSDLRQGLYLNLDQCVAAAADACGDVDGDQRVEVCEKVMNAEKEFEPQ